MTGPARRADTPVVSSSVSRSSMEENETEVERPTFFSRALTDRPKSCDSYEMSLGGNESRRAWFPFRAAEIEIVLGVFGFLATFAASFGVDAKDLALGAGIYLAVAYLAGLFVYARRSASSFTFLRDGGLGGAGYVEPFRRAERSLLLTHVDDDAPSAELQGLYRTLLDRGVQMRRVIFRRPSASADGVRWVRSFGNHQNLLQRIVPEPFSTSMCLSFVVIDAAEVIVSVPGSEAADAKTYSDRQVFRHLLIIRDRAVASAFLQMHQDLWQRAKPLPDAKRLDVNYDSKKATT